MTSTSLKLKFGPNETFALLPQITAMIEKKKKKKKHAPRDIELKKKIKISFKDVGINWQL